MKSFTCLSQGTDRGQHLDDLGNAFVRELQEFFVNYHRLSGEKYKVLGVKGPAEARKTIDKQVKK